MPFAAALGVAGDQGVLVGAGAVHPVQLARHAQPGLVEPGHLGLGDPVADLVEEPVQPVGGAFGHRRHGAFGDRGAEQLGQRLRGALLRQELPDIQVEDDRGDPRPVLHRRAHALPARCRSVVAPQPQRRAISWCSVTRTVIGGRSNTCRRSMPTSGASARSAPHPAHGPGSCRMPLVRVGDQRQRRPRMPRLPARLAAALAAQRLRRRLDERRVRRRRLRRVLEFFPSCRFSSASSASSAAIRPARHHPRLPDDQGGELVIRRTPIPGLHPMIIPCGRSRPHRT